MSCSLWGTRLIHSGHRKRSHWLSQLLPHLVCFTLKWELLQLPFPQLLINTSEERLGSSCIQLWTNAPSVRSSRYGLYCLPHCSVYHTLLSVTLQCVSHLTVCCTTVCIEPIMYACMHTYTYIHIYIYTHIHIFTKCLASHMVALNPWSPLLWEVYVDNWVDHGGETTLYAVHAVHKRFPSACAPVTNGISPFVYLGQYNRFNFQIYMRVTE